jgi:hypothetical protein
MDDDFTKETLDIVRAAKFTPGARTAADSGGVGIAEGFSRS